MKQLCCLAIGLVLLATPTFAANSPPTIDGSAADTLYGTTALAVQDTQTGFGDASLGRPDVCDGSELDGAYGVVYNGTLYLVLAGNFQTNGNWVEIFFDTRAGGQNRLLATNPGPAGAELLRMSDDGSGNGLTFQTGFDADFWVTAHAFGDPTVVTVHYAELYVNAGNPGGYYNCGDGAPKCTTSGGALSGGDAGAPAILATVDNSNIFGVTGGYGGGDGSGVITGFEFAIPLSAIGNPAGNFKITAFINGQQHDYVSNQVLGGFAGLIAANPAEPRLVNFATLAFGVQQPFTVPVSSTPSGACCVGTACSIKTAAQCAAASGTYLGDNSNCDGNPCNAVAQGRCCIDDGLSGQCLIREQSQCTSLGGTWGGAGTTCESCPCLLPPKGACCIAGVCSLQTEAACLASSGSYVGNYTNCNGDNPCDSGACCRDLTCTVEMRFQCGTGAGRFIGAGTDCSASPCAAPTLPTPHVTGDWLGWNPADPAQAMTETFAGSRIFTKNYTGFAAAEYHQYKITNGVDWTNAIPTTANGWFLADSSGNVTITYDANYYSDGWSPARDRLPLPAYSDPGSFTAVGEFQAGGPGYQAGDWTNNDPNTVMTSLGSGIYKFERSGFGAGAYIGKATRTGTWDAMGANGRSTDATNFSFTIGATTDKLQIWADALKGTAKVVVVPAVTICRGDLNCDGSINFGDINPFVLYLSNPSAWQTANPGCPPENGDINADGSLHSFGDINPFVALLSQQPPPTCP